MRALSVAVACVALTLLSLGAVAAQFPRWHQIELLKYNYAMYVRDANRPYVKGTEAYAARERIFNARLADIKAHNRDLSRTWKRGINDFADWTAEEWANYNRARPDLGRKATIPEHLFVPVTKTARELPKTTDYRDRTNPPILTGIKNQGSCGSCWAHAATEEMESFFALRFGQLPVLSTQQVTSCTLTESGCGGGSFVAAWEAAQQYGGVNEEFTYPYTDFFAPNMEWKYTSKCYNVSDKFPQISTGVGNQTFLFTWYPKVNISGYTRVPRNDAHAMMEAIATKGPVAISVASGQWPDYESGVLQNNYTDLNSNYTWQSIDHDVQLVGYGYDFDLNVNYWVVRNSWGTNYGENGYIRLLRPEVEPCGNLTGSTICGTSGVLCNPGYPEVSPLDLQNGYYF